MIFVVLLNLPVLIKGVFIMGGAGIIWGAIICIPFWLIVILFVKTGIIAMETIIFVGLVLSGLLLFLILTSHPNTKQDEQDQQMFSPAKKNRPLYAMKMGFKLADNGGTRAGIDRRKFNYTAYIPEKRSGMDRRKGFDRRSLMARKRESERRMVFKTQSMN
jgi:hypothetical protein